MPPFLLGHSPRPSLGVKQPINMTVSDTDATTTDDAQTTTNDEDETPPECPDCGGAMSEKIEGVFTTHRKLWKCLDLECGHEIERDD